MEKLVIFYTLTQRYKWSRLAISQVEKKKLSC